MAISKPLATYAKVLENSSSQFMIQIDLSHQRIKEVNNVYIQSRNTVDLIMQAVEHDNIVEAFYSMVNEDDTTSVYYQFKNDVLHVVACEGDIVYADDFIWFEAKRYAQPIESLEDDIDIPQSKVPLFVNKVLANIYHLQGKEVPITIKRRIKELE